MQVDIQLSGVTSSWRFPGSATLQTWLERRPWLDDGGLCVLRTPDSATGMLFDAIRRSAHSVHGDDGHFSVRLVMCGGGLETPCQALTNHFNLNRSALESRDAIRLNLRDKRQLLVFAERSAVSIDEWEAFAALIEHLSKSALAVPLAIAILDARSQLNCEPVCQFVFGYSNLQVFEGAAALDELAVWKRYLHMRSWWDAGGYLAHAQHLSELCEGVPQGDDSATEAVLQTYAVESLKCHPGAATLRAMLGIAQKSGGAIQVPTRLEAELLEAHLLWRPPGRQSLHVVPFAARAMLAEANLPVDKILRLRTELVCAPLMSEILGLCQFFEAQIRSRLRGREDASHLTGEATTRFQNFIAGRDRFANYPAGHPSPPGRVDDVFAFASLGELLKCCPNRAVSDLDRSVQHLRNCLAHGHYVAWSHCCYALRALRNLDTGSR